MTHRNPQHKDETILWARNILSTKNKYVIFDTETTGLKKNDVILQIGLLDLDGNELLSTLIKPTKRKRIAQQATEIHGIKIEDLQTAPTFSEIRSQLENLVKSKTVLIYNAAYDEKLVEQTCEQDECSYLKMKTECVMIQYSRFVGKWSKTHSDYAFQKLPGGDHSAIGDCRATLAVIQKMAESKLSTENSKSSMAQNTVKKEPVKISEPQSKKWWEFWK